MMRWAWPEPLLAPSQVSWGRSEEPSWGPLETRAGPEVVTGVSWPHRRRRQRRAQTKPRSRASTVDHAEPGEVESRRPGGGQPPERTGAKTRRGDKRPRLTCWPPWSRAPSHAQVHGCPHLGAAPRSVEESSGQGAVATWAPGRCLHGLRGRPLSRLVARLSSCASAVPWASPARPPGRGSARGSGFQSQARQETAGEDGAARPPRSICVHAATAS